MFFKCAYHVSYVSARKNLSFQRDSKFLIVSLYTNPILILVFRNYFYLLYLYHLHNDNNLVIV